jgi:dihydroneopterin aldolase
VTDSITLTGLAVRANHGVFDFEREQGQTFVIDVTVWLDLGPAASGDALAETVHYGELAEAVHAAVASDPVDLIETVAERVARVALSFAAVERVRATVHKPDAPIPVPFGDVAVTIERDRAWAQLADEGEARA